MMSTVRRSPRALLAIKRSKLLLLPTPEPGRRDDPAVALRRQQLEEEISELELAVGEFRLPTLPPARRDIDG